MMVTFNNFMMNSTTSYKSATFILDISKQDAPPTRGLFNFFGTNGSIVSLSKPAQNIQIPLRWSMFYVDNIKLICNIPGTPPLERNYFRSDQSPNIQPLAYDKYTLTLPIQVTQDTPVFITLQAFDNNNNYLNALQFTIFVSASFFVDPAGQVYPTVFLNNQTWLASNYNFNSGAGCVAYGNVNGNRTQYGLLYTEAVAAANTPPGWRIPTQTDWNNLITALGANAFTALFAGGSSGFSAQAGGMGDNMGNFSSMGTLGYYWTSTPNSQQPGNNFDTLFNPSKSSVNTVNSIDNSYFLSVRYVKNT
jgi:uncharacterized protein (TIGR02145 family)